MPVPKSRPFSDDVDHLEKDSRGLRELVKQGRRNGGRLEKNQPLEYDKGGDQGSDELAPTPKEGLSADEKKTFIKATLEDLSDDALTKVFDLVSEIRDAAERPEIPQWKDRDVLYPNQAINSVTWIKMHYGETNSNGEWHRGRLTRAMLKDDQTLYDAYSKWVKNHPEDDLQLPKGQRRRRKSSQEVVKNRQIANQAYYKKRREAAP